MAEKKVNFYSGAGLKLTGYLHTPNGGEGQRRPGVVLCRGLGGREFLTPKVADWLTESGYVALRFHYRGYGESEGVRYRMLPLEQVEDVLSAVTFLGCQDSVDPGRIGLWGAASGGANVCYAAGVDSRAKCVVSVSGMGDCGRWLRSKRRYWEWREFLERLDEDRVARVMTGQSRCVEPGDIMPHDPALKEYLVAVPDGNPGGDMGKILLSLESAEAMLSFRPETVVSRISPRAAMCICAGEDTTVPVDEARSMYDAAREPKRLVVFDGMTHYQLYHDSGFERMMAMTTEWFDAHLKK